MPIDMRSEIEERCKREANERKSNEIAESLKEKVGALLAKNNTKAYSVEELMSEFGLYNDAEKVHWRAMYTAAWWARPSHNFERNGLQYWMYGDKH